MPMFSPVNETIIPYFAKFYKPDEPNQPDPRSGFPMFWDIDSLDESSSSKNGKYYLTVTFNDGYGNAYRNRYTSEFLSMKGKTNLKTGLKTGLKTDLKIDSKSHTRQFELIREACCGKKNYFD